MIEPGERVHATYLMETAFPLREAAEAMAGEQSPAPSSVWPARPPSCTRPTPRASRALRSLSQPPRPPCPAPRFRRRQSADLASGPGAALLAGFQFRREPAEHSRHCGRQSVRARPILGPAPHRPALPAELRLSRTRLRDRGNASHGRRRARTAGRHDRQAERRTFPRSHGRDGARAMRGRH
jgi:hypothetical protein